MSSFFKTLIKCEQCTPFAEERSDVFWFLKLRLVETVPTSSAERLFYFKCGLSRRFLFEDWDMDMTKKVSVGEGGGGSP